MDKWFDFDLVWEALPELLSYLPITLLIFFGALVLSAFVGFLLAFPRIYKIPVLNILSVVFVSYIRGVPILVQLILTYYILPGLLLLIKIDVSSAPALVFVIIAYGLSMGAKFSDIIRSAIGSVDRGQIEAAASIGMTSFSIFTRIIFPQAVAVAIPNYANMVIFGLKSTSLAFSIGVMDMIGRGQAIGAQTMHFFEVYVSMAIIYYILCLILERIFAYLEVRALRYECKEVSYGL